MAAITADRFSIKTFKPGSIDGAVAYPIADNVHVYKQALVMSNASGYLDNAADTSGCTFVGIADEGYDNTITGHAAAAVSLRVSSGVIARLPGTGFAQSDVGAAVYVADNATVSKTATNYLFVGQIVRYNSSTSVDVFIPPCGASAPLTTISGLTATAAELNQIHSVTPGTVTASKALVVGTTKNLDTLIINGTGAAAFAVGPNGATNPVLQVDSSVGSEATGIKVTGAAAASGVAIAAISSSAAEALKVDAKGTGAVNIGGVSTGLVTLGRGVLNAVIFGSTKAVLSAQNVTPTAAQLLGGIVEHVSATGAGTCTLDTAANIDTAIAGAANGDTFECVLANTGNQTSTITTNTGLTLKGTAAVPTLKNAILTFFRTGAGAWTVYITLSA